MKRWLQKLKSWKPIHLCWLFRKLHLAIPRYLIGGGSDFFLQGGRIANATRVWQAAQDVNVIDWNKINDVIVATMFETDVHGSSSTTFYLHWRNKTDGGSFGVLGSSGELTYNADTDLVNGNAVIHSEEGITARYPANHEDGKELEGVSLRVIILLKEWHEEFQWAVDCCNAHDGDEYEFAIYDSEAATYVGTLASTITMAGGVSVTPIPRTSVAVALIGAIILGSIVITPAPATSIGAVVEPTVVIGGGGETVSPSPVSVVAGIVNPIVIKGSISITPTPLSSVTGKNNPTVVLGSLVITPSEASAIAVSINPTVLGGGGFVRTCDGDYTLEDMNIQSSVSRSSFSKTSYSKSSHDARK